MVTETGILSLAFITNQISKNGVTKCAAIEQDGTAEWSTIEDGMINVEYPEHKFNGTHSLEWTVNVHSGMYASSITTFLDYGQRLMKVEQESLGCHW